MSPEKSNAIEIGNNDNEASQPEPGAAENNTAKCKVKG